MSTSVNTKSMFEAIKQSLVSAEKSGGGNGLYKEILKFEAGNTYQVRLVPNPSAPAESIYHYYNHGWNSNSTGKFVTALCPTTFGESCPIDAYYLKTYRTGTESEKAAASVLSRKEAWCANVYVISDPTNPENEGKVKILRCGKELAKIIDSALKGDDADEFGVEKVYDVENGSTLRIKCEARTGNGRGGNKKMVTYASSKFVSPSKIDIDIEEVYGSIHDLKALNKQTTVADMQRMLDEHFFNLTTGSAPEVEDAEDEETYTTPTKSETKSSNSESEDADETTDEKLKKLLADL